MHHFHSLFAQKFSTEAVRWDSFVNTLPPSHTKTHRRLCSLLEVNEDGPTLPVAKHSSGSVDFSDVQIVHKFARLVSPT